MANESGEWIMRGMRWDDPYRIRSWKELVNWIQEIGFLPFFANDIPGNLPPFLPAFRRGIFYLPDTEFQYHARHKERRTRDFDRLRIP